MLNCVPLPAYEKTKQNKTKHLQFYKIFHFKVALTECQCAYYITRIAIYLYARF